MPQDIHAIILEGVAAQIVKTADAMSRAEILLSTGYFNDKPGLKANVESALAHCQENVDDLETWKGFAATNTAALLELLPGDGSRA